MAATSASRTGEPKGVGSPSATKPASAARFASSIGRSWYRRRDDRALMISVIGFEKSMTMPPP